MALFCILLFTGCSEKEYSFIIESAQYRFNPQGNLTPDGVAVSLTPEPNVLSGDLLSRDSQPINGHQEQFLSIIKGIASEEVNADAKIVDVFFATSCKHVEFGPQALEITFSWIGTHENMETRFEMLVGIDAQAGYLKQRLVGIRPPSEILSVGDLELKLPAEEILVYSERSGGKEFRESNSNSCTIHGNLIGNEWLITYVPSNQPGSNQTTRFHIVFDATSGKIKPPN